MKKKGDLMRRKFSSQDAVFINQEAQLLFKKHYKQFLIKFGHIRKAQDKLLSAIEKTSTRSSQDTIIISLAILIFEDFDEICFLLANGSTTGAMKIIRGMFERTVTLNYLISHQEEIDLFSKYFFVRRRKAAKAIVDNIPGILSSDMLEQIEKDFEAVKNLFEIKRCKKCSTLDVDHEWAKIDVNFNWTKKDIISMAKEVGNFSSVIFHGYYQPIEETHSTVDAIIRRFKRTYHGNSLEDIIISEDHKNTLASSHYMFLKTIEATNTYFQLKGIKRINQTCLRDFAKVWKKLNKDLEVKRNKLRNKQKDSD